MATILDHNRDNFDLCKSEFLAEKQFISIIPNFNSPIIQLLSQIVGPFEAGLTLDVPLWIALYLKQRQKCRIIPPAWLKMEVLENLKDAEIQGHLFVELPNPHFLEMAQLLLQYASDDIPDSMSLKTLVCDVSDARMAKLRNNMDIFVKSESTYAKINNLTQFEISRIRDFFTSALDQVHRLQEAANALVDRDDY